MSGDRGSGQVITFYSYKGGTGRSMALANLAWVLATAGRHVLAIDWDLEAPGLHRYFHPFLSDPELTSTEGVIDFVIRFVEEASARPADTQRTNDWYLPYSRIAHYANSVDYPFPNGGVLDFIPAGKQGEAYSARVNALNWKHFYERLGGWSVIEEMRADLLTQYDVVLIDSRTGVSDTAGICTVQLPDTVVVCFTLNFQSIDGASAVARSIVAQRTRLGRPVRVLPVPTRVELSAEKVKYEEVSTYALRRFLSTTEQRQPIGDMEPRTYWDQVAVPYIGFYVFEEQLAWFLDQNRTTGVLAATLRLATHAAGVEAADLAPPTDRERQGTIGQYAAVWKERLRESRRIDYGLTCLVLMPFGTKSIVDGHGQMRTVDFDAVYAEVFEPAIRKVTLGDGTALAPIRADQDFFSGEISRVMLNSLEQSRFVVADLTGLNPNVMYELGVRHRANQSGTAIFRQIDAKIPFDLNQIKAFPYEYGDPSRNEESLRLVIRVLEESLSRNDTTAAPLPRSEEGQRAHVEAGILAAENALRVFDRTKAIAEYRSVLRLDPDNVTVRLRLGLLLRDDGAWREALEQFDQAVALAPGNGDAWREKGIAENKLFGRKVRRDNEPDGRASLQRAIELNPDDFDALASLGGVLKRGGQLFEALAAYERATTVSHGHPYPLLNQIALRAMLSGRVELNEVLHGQVVRAERALAAQVGSDPPYDPPWSFFDLAELNLFLGSPGEAITFAERGIEYAEASWQLESFRQTLQQIADAGVQLPGLVDIIELLRSRVGYFPSH
jgi:MinD-like ATPase involved in chromosome partitioning or flagellar assembly/tetratricopeptide (TPR) repeat protein